MSCKRIEFEKIRNKKQKQKWNKANNPYIPSDIRMFWECINVTNEYVYIFQNSMLLLTFNLTTAKK